MRKMPLYNYESPALPLSYIDAIFRIRLSGYVCKKTSAASSAVILPDRAQGPSSSMTHLDWSRRVRRL